jgi:hypothetical protein
MLLLLMTATVLLFLQLPRKARKVLSAPPDLPAHKVKPEPQAPPALRALPVHKV